MAALYSMYFGSLAQWRTPMILAVPNGAALVAVGGL
jgi:hypothetical protein